MVASGAVAIFLLFGDCCIIRLQTIMKLRLSRVLCSFQWLLKRVNKHQFTFKYRTMITQFEYNIAGIITTVMSIFIQTVGGASRLTNMNTELRFCGATFTDWWWGYGLHRIRANRVAPLVVVLFACQWPPCGKPHQTRRFVLEATRSDVPFTRSKLKRKRSTVWPT